MARKTPSRLDKRRELEAAEARGAAGPKTKKKKATRKKATTTRRASAKAAVRKRLVWAVFNGSMKEEARFPYGERAAAEDKLEQLRTRSPKKMFFIQAVKEEIAAAAPSAAGKASTDEEE